MSKTFVIDGGRYFVDGAEVPKATWDALRAEQESATEAADDEADNERVWPKEDDPMNRKP